MIIASQLVYQLFYSPPKEIKTCEEFKHLLQPPLPSVHLEQSSVVWNL